MQQDCLACKSPQRKATVSDYSHSALSDFGRTNPAKVINFLNVAAAWDKRQGGWDPSLGLVSI